MMSAPRARCLSRAEFKRENESSGDGRKAGRSRTFQMRVSVERMMKICFFILEMLYYYFTRNSGARERRDANCAQNGSRNELKSSPEQDP